MLMAQAHHTVTAMVWYLSASATATTIPAQATTAPNCP